MVERRPEKAGVASSILAPGTIHPFKVFITEEVDLACSADTIRRAFNVDFATCLNVKQGAEVQLGPDNGGNDSEIAAISGKQLPFVATRSCGPRRTESRYTRIAIGATGNIKSPPIKSHLRKFYRLKRWRRCSRVHDRVKGDRSTISADEVRARLVTR